MLDEFEEPTAEEIEGQIEATGGAAQQDEPKLYAGKYKSADELESAYAEMQKVLGKQARAVGQLRSLGYDVDDEGNVIAPQTYQQEEQVTNYEPAATTEDPNELFWQNPQQATMSIIQQVTRQQKMARVNIESQVNTRKSDPTFNSVAAEYIQQMNSIDDNIMADPRAAAYYGETLYNMVVGQKARQMATQGREDPSVRSRILKELGVEGPQPSDAKTGVEEVNEKDKRMLESLGFGGKARQEVVENWQKRREEED